MRARHSILVIALAVGAVACNSASDNTSATTATPDDTTSAPDDTTKTPVTTPATTAAPTNSVVIDGDEEATPGGAGVALPATPTVPSGDRDIDSDTPEPVPTVAVTQLDDTQFIDVVVNAVGATVTSTQDLTGEVGTQAEAAGVDAGNITAVVVHHTDNAAAAAAVVAAIGGGDDLDAAETSAVAATADGAVAAVVSDNVTFIITATGPNALSVAFDAAVTARNTFTTTALTPRP